ncbi:hypothetical protein ACFU6R_10735 [Streptomyces sp. NPDC057499]|uniref:hypothetical protein n=1 Tax=Streptomyces sp. NPDC057499 TaxID=3346150 RepID=UPI0036BCC3B2
MRVTEGGESVGFNGSISGAAGLHLADGVALLRPEEQVFTAMLTGFANQQPARNLARTTVEGRENTVKAFAAYVNTYPWFWTPAMVDEWLGNLRSLRDLKPSMIRSYSEAVRAFCHFITDPLYEWTATCEERFGTHPVQVVHEWNTAVHVQDDEADAKKRAFTKAELHAFFAPCDDEVARTRRRGRSRLPRQDHQPHPQRDRRHLEPIRRRRPREVTGRLGTQNNRRELISRAHLPSV